MGFGNDVRHEGWRILLGKSFIAQIMSPTKVNNLTESNNYPQSFKEVSFQVPLVPSFNRLLPSPVKQTLKSSCLKIGNKLNIIAVNK